jgi:hypothetical protein
VSKPLSALRLKASRNADAGERIRRVPSMRGARVMEKRRLEIRDL